MLRTRLIWTLVGMILMTGVFMTRDAIDAFHRMDQRLSYVEGYIQALDQFLRSNGNGQQAAHF